MYTEFFGLNEKPFSITPDPRYLYLSRRHADALAHLIYGISESGGFIQLTGEVGTGKTTLIRSLLEQLPEKAEIALILNPQLSAKEFLESICEELGTPLPEESSQRALIGALNGHLLKAHAEGRRIVLIVDEAQTLGPELLEQVRLLTNLETATQKLLQIILIGQPELRDLLGRPEMRQVAQRVTGRYHLEPLSRVETDAYVRHRMRVAGCQSPVFTPSAIRQLYRSSGGIPRLINVVADRALLAAYTRDSPRVDGPLVRRAAAEVFGRRLAPALWPWPVLAAGIAAVAFGGIDLWLEARNPPAAVSAPAASDGTSESAATATPPGPATTPQGPGASPLGTVVARTAVGEVRRPEPPDAEPASAARPRLAQLLGTAEFPTDTDSAFAQLFALWGARYDPARGNPCGQAEEQGLKCLFQSRGSIGRLRTLNRPAILTLVDAEGEAHDVVLAGLEYSEAELAAAGHVARVDLSELTHYWFGDHLLLWRPAISDAHALSPGMQGEGVQWLRVSLARIRGEELAGEPSPLYDAPLEAKVRDYQRRKMLTVDGIVGAMTQLALTADLGLPAAPTLQRKH
ncbi:MAG TPA: AAA family ATPase [Gammaproteobacteria bacterium]